MEPAVKDKLLENAQQRLYKLSLLDFEEVSLELNFKFGEGSKFLALVDLDTLEALHKSVETILKRYAKHKPSMVVAALKLLGAIESAVAYRLNTQPIDSVDTLNTLARLYEAVNHRTALIQSHSPDNEVVQIAYVQDISAASKTTTSTSLNLLINSVSVDPSGVLSVFKEVTAPFVTGWSIVQMANRNGLLRSVFDVYAAFKHETSIEAFLAKRYPDGTQVRVHKKYLGCEVVKECPTVKGHPLGRSLKVMDNRYALIDMDEYLNESTIRAAASQSHVSSSLARQLIEANRSLDPVACGTRITSPQFMVTAIDLSSGKRVKLHVQALELADIAKQRSVVKLFEDVYMSDESRAFFTGIVRSIRKKGCIFESMLLHGEPGYGKSMIARRVCEHAGLPALHRSVGQFGLDAVSLNSSLRDTADLARSLNAVLVIDDADYIVYGRSLDHSRLSLMNEILQFFDYYRGPKIMTTNVTLADLDKAIVSRCDVIYGITRWTMNWEGIFKEQLAALAGSKCEYLQSEEFIENYKFITRVGVRYKDWSIRSLVNLAKQTVNDHRFSNSIDAVKLTKILAEKQLGI